jgi:hypothetical protein
LWFVVSYPYCLDLSRKRLDLDSVVSYPLYCLACSCLEKD